jgi:hypothetical protein
MLNPGCDSVLWTAASEAGQAIHPRFATQQASTIAHPRQTACAAGSSGFRQRMSLAPSAPATRTSSIGTANCGHENACRIRASPRCETPSSSPTTPARSYRRGSPKKSRPPVDTWWPEINAFIATGITERPQWSCGKSCAGSDPNPRMRASSRRASTKAVNVAA